MGRYGGVRGERTDHTKIFRRTLAGFGLTGRQKVHFSTFDGKLELQCARNGSQNLPFCPGSIQDTFIIYSSISHQHIVQTFFAKIQNLEHRKSGHLKNRSWKVKVSSFVSVGTVNIETLEPIKHQIMAYIFPTVDAPMKNRYEQKQIGLPFYSFMMHYRYQYINVGRNIVTNLYCATNVLIA